MTTTNLEFEVIDLTVDEEDGLDFIKHQDMSTINMFNSVQDDYTLLLRSSLEYSYHEFEWRKDKLVVYHKKLLGFIFKENNTSIERQKCIKSYIDVVTALNTISDKPSRFKLEEIIDYSLEYLKVQKCELEILLEFGDYSNDEIQTDLDLLGLVKDKLDELSILSDDFLNSALKSMEKEEMQNNLEKIFIGNNDIKTNTNTKTKTKTNTNTNTKTNTNTNTKTKTKTKNKPEKEPKKGRNVVLHPRKRTKRTLYVPGEYNCYGK